MDQLPNASRRRDYSAPGDGDEALRVRRVVVVVNILDRRGERANHPRIRYRELLRMPAGVGLAAAARVCRSGVVVLSVWLPKYLSDVRRFSMVEIT